MRRILDLSSALAKVNADTLSRFGGTGSTSMAVAAEVIANRFKTSTRPRHAPAFADRMAEAIRRFRDQREDVEFRTLRLACHGCSHYVEADGYVMLGDPEAFGALGNLVLGYAGEPRRFRRLFDGLLRAYLSAARGADWFARPEVQNGNEKLRRYLQTTFAQIEGVEPAPEWVGALSDYPEVLSRDPGRRFALDWLANRQSTLRNAADRLGLAGSSWLTGEVLRSALESAVAADDRTFAGHISSFLSAAAEQRFQALRDDIYVGLLTRYGAMASPPVHSALRDALVLAWKNPWLARNDSAWGRVGEAPRKLVEGWLKLELIHQFFEVLSEDGRQERRRFEFWRKYHERMDDVYFALGGQAYHSRSPDMVKLRRSLDGRLLELTGTASSTHAFVMCLGDTVVVEFSMTGNAAHMYPRRDLKIDAAARAINVGVLRGENSERLIHRDTGACRWEENFGQRLSATLGGSGRTRVGAAFAHVLRPTYTPSGAGRFAAGPRSGGSDEEIRRFAQGANIEVEDRRPMGGWLCLRYHGDSQAVVQRLERWGFKHAPGKGWRRSGP